MTTFFSYLFPQSKHQDVLFQVKLNKYFNLWKLRKKWGFKKIIEINLSSCFELCLYKFKLQKISKQTNPTLEINTWEWTKKVSLDLTETFIWSKTTLYHSLSNGRRKTKERNLLSQPDWFFLYLFLLLFSYSIKNSFIPTNIKPC